jgi:hypothetical protein
MVECADLTLLAADAFAYERPRRDPPSSIRRPGSAIFVQYGRAPHLAPLRASSLELENSPLEPLLTGGPRVRFPFAPPVSLIPGGGARSGPRSFADEAILHQIERVFACLVQPASRSSPVPLVTRTRPSTAILPERPRHGLGKKRVNIPAVIINDRVSVKLPVKVIRIIAAIVFAPLGALILKAELATLPKHGGPIKSV